jgi:hypothetical protein
VASLMDRLRFWLGLDGEHSEEHADLRRELTEQRSRIRRLDAYVEARGYGRDRRRMMTPTHPRRRVTDG